MPNYEELFHLDSGLRGNMDLTIHMAYFSTHAEYQNGNTYLLFLTGVDEAGDPQEVRMSVGGDWTSSDGGKTITHPTKKFINRNTIYGHFLSHALEVPELRATLASRGGPLTAAIWDNLIIHLDLTEISFGRNLDPQERLMPTKFLGIYTEGAVPATPQTVVADSPPLTPAPVQATVTPTTPSPADLVAAAKAKAAAQSNGASPLYTEMFELAKSSTTFQDFMGQAFAREDVLADEELAVQVADDKAGIWSAAHPS